MNDWYEINTQGTLLHLRVQPGARQDSLGDTRNGRKIVRITAPPVDGKANKHLIKFLAKTFHVRQSHITLIKGSTHRNKTLLICKLFTLPENMTSP